MTQIDDTMLPQHPGRFWTWLAEHFGPRSDAKARKSLAVIAEIAEKTYGLGELVARQNGLLYIGGDADSLPIVMETRYQEEGVHVLYCRVPNGAEMGRHSHPHAHEIIYGIRGRLEMADADGAKTIVGPGDAYHIPPGQGHSARGLSECRVLAVTVPRTSEYADG